METAEKPNHFFQDTTRIEAFSDGVFGFALPLLVLDIHVPDRVVGETLVQTLLQQRSGFLAFPANLGLFVLMFLVFIFPEKMAIIIMRWWGKVLPKHNSN